jgi:hypothetical protein
MPPPAKKDVSKNGIIMSIINKTASNLPVPVQVQGLELKQVEILLLNRHNPWCFIFKKTD